MKIIRVKSENVKRLSAVEIKPDGNLIVIGGDNGAGKSSVLDSIAMALGGKNEVPAKPIRDGQESAVVVVELDDLIVTRKFTAKGSTLSVASRKGAKYPSPQAMLDELHGKLSFDPLAFSRMKPADQATQIRAMVGIDTEEADGLKAGLYEQRRDTNRDLKAETARLSDAPQHDDTPSELVMVSELMGQRQFIIDAQRRAEISIDTSNVASSEVTRLERELEVLSRNLAEARDEAIRAKTSAEKDQNSLEGFDLEAIDKMIREAGETNQAIRDNQAYAELDNSVNSMTQQSQDLTKQINQIDEDKAKVLAEAKYPVAGLGFTDDGLVTFNDIPFEQASAAEQLRVSVAMGLAMNPTLRVLLIRDGSLLDSKSLAMVAEMAAEQDAQVWIERVGSGEEVTVVIEDGRVKE